MKTDLKGISQNMQDDMTNNNQWFDREVSFVLDGSHNSGYIIQEHISNTLDITKKNYGKRGSNLVAYCGLTAIADIYQVNHNQALSIWKYLSKEHKEQYDQLIKDLLENISNEMED